MCLLSKQGRPPGSQSCQVVQSTRCRYRSDCRRHRTWHHQSRSKRSSHPHQKENNSKAHSWGCVQSLQQVVIFVIWSYMCDHGCVFCDILPVVTSLVLITTYRFLVARQKAAWELWLRLVVLLGIPNCWSAQLQVEAEVTPDYPVEEVLHGNSRGCSINRGPFRSAHM